MGYPAFLSIALILIIMNLISWLLNTLLSRFDCCFIAPRRRYRSFSNNGTKQTEDLKDFSVSGKGGLKIQFYNSKDVYSDNCFIIYINICDIMKIAIIFCGIFTLPSAPRG